jgi:hypothetical protein
MVFSQPFHIASHDFPFGELLLDSPYDQLFVRVGMLVSQTVSESDHVEEAQEALRIRSTAASLNSSTVIFFHQLAVP